MITGKITDKYFLVAYKPSSGSYNDFGEHSSDYHTGHYTGPELTKKIAELLDRQYFARDEEGFQFEVYKPVLHDGEIFVGLSFSAESDSDVAIPPNMIWDAALLLRRDEDERRKRAAATVEENKRKVKDAQSKKEREALFHELLEEFGVPEKLERAAVRNRNDAESRS